MERRWRLETRWSVVSSFIHTTQRSRSIKEANHAIERGECERANANKQRGPFTIAESNLKLIGSKQFVGTGGSKQEAEQNAAAKLLKDKNIN